MVFKRSARKALLKLSPTVQHRLIERIQGLADNPRLPGVKKLKGAASLWRVREGRHRLVYEIYDQRPVVLVMRIGDRKDIYR